MIWNAPWRKVTPGTLCERESNLKMHATRIWKGWKF